MEHGCVVFILRPRQVNWNRIEIYIRCVSTYYYKEMSGGVSLKHNILLVYVLQQLLTERREISKFIESNLICSIDKFYLSTCVFKSKKFYYIFIIIVIFNHFFFFYLAYQKRGRHNCPTLNKTLYPHLCCSSLLSFTKSSLR